MPAVWESMRRPPNKLLLFDNPLTEISNLKIKSTQVYLSCNKLEKVLNSSFNCLNPENFVFTLPIGRGWIDFASKVDILVPGLTIMLRVANLAPLATIKNAEVPH